MNKKELDDCWDDFEFQREHDYLNPEKHLEKNLEEYYVEEKDNEDSDEFFDEDYED